MSLNDSSRSARLLQTLNRLRNATAAERDDAWTEFLAAYSGTLLHVCHAMAHDRDLAMDAYAFAIEVLRADDCRRLRAYVPDPNVRFTSWLVVVTRRLVLDFVRQRYGRSRSTTLGYQEQHLARRRLEDLLTDEIDPDDLPSGGGADAEAVLRRRELTRALSGALDGLSSTDRLLLALRFEDDRPVREIAKTLGLPSVFHVYRRLTAVLATLRDVLRRRGIDAAQP